uniref:Lactosylceramide alpha-2,3-sialyltransferase n=1 Tax=Cyprinus carpio carpio TaxID=630221 RepID=A0A8C1HTZ2_CYPCA
MKISNSKKMHTSNKVKKCVHIKLNCSWKSVYGANISSYLYSAAFGKSHTEYEECESFRSQRIQTSLQSPGGLLPDGTQRKWSRDPPCNSNCKLVIVFVRAASLQQHTPSALRISSETCSAVEHIRKCTPLVEVSSSEERIQRLAIMRRAIRQWQCEPSRRLFIPLVGLVLILLALLKLPACHLDPKPVEVPVDPVYRKHVQSYVRDILAQECKPSFARQRMEAGHYSSTPVLEPFLDKNTHLNEQIFQYPSPFGFLDMKNKLQEILDILPASSEERRGGRDCRRCLVIGNGGILKGLGLGPLFNQFDTIIRLNSGPVRGFSADVGNRTSIRMSYPEGSPKVWEDMDSDLRFVAVIYKPVDFHWLRAMITKTSVSLWDWLYFWQNVPVSLPLKASQFRLLNPEIIRETALDLLHYPSVKDWDKNVPTLGVSALNLATYLCDEVSLAGFGYNLSQKDAPLHYYDHKLMTSMLKEATHDVQTETAFLKRLVTSGSITDLTGGIHCRFCSR